MYDLGALLLTNRPDKQASQVSNCHIVPLSWLLESAEAKKPLPESKYSFGQASQPDDDTQKTADAAPAENKRITRKRGADTAPAETQDTQKNGADSKAKPSEDKKPASKKRSATEDPVKNGSDKKTKDIQKTTKKTINVPVDEGFMEFGKIKGKSSMRHLMWGSQTNTRHRSQGLH